MSPARTREYRGQKYLDVRIGDEKRRLPIVAAGKDVWIASDAELVLGDVQFIQTCAGLLVKRIGDLRVELIITAEAKSIPLAYAVATLLGHERFIIVRKSVKGYMKEFLEEEVKSITTREKQKLILSDEDRRSIERKRVCILDDVVSTGKTLVALERLIARAKGIVACKCAIWREGPWYKGKDLICLDTLPIFIKR